MLFASARHYINRFAIATILAIGLLALAWPAEAQIVYTPVNITIEPRPGWSSYNLDVNNDGVTDFTITIEEVIVGPYLIGSVSETPASENAVLIGPLSEGDEIGPDQGFTGGTLGPESFVYGCSFGVIGHSGCGWRFSGPWDAPHLKGNRYLGLSFQLNGETYYGWVQLRLPKGGADGVKLSGYAYESTPGMPINAGQKK